MTGKQFYFRFLSSELFGFAFGVPVATLYAVILVEIESSKVTDLITFIGILTVIIVCCIAFPMNHYFILRGLRKKTEDLDRNRLEKTAGIVLFNRLNKSPLMFGFFIFIRICFGAIITATYMYFFLHIIFIQCITALFLAFYGGYLAGILAYIVTGGVVSHVTKKIVQQNILDRDYILKKKYFHTSLTVKIILLLIIPVIFTNASVYLSLVASAAKNLAYGLTLTKIFYLLIINALTITFSVILILYTIKKPVSVIQESLMQLAENEGDLTSFIPTDLSDEFAYNSFLMNQAILNTRELIKKLKNISDIISSSIQNLSTTSQEISSTSNEQAVAVNEIVSTMEDSDSLSKLIRDKIQNVNALGDRTKGNVDQGFIIIKENSDKMEEIKKTNIHTIDEIKVFIEQIDSIQEILKIITNVANQTKIIAFNAELEASAAGEAGKNFEIVANEIRRLADNTVASTNEIKSALKNIQKSSDSLIHASEKETDKITEGWNVSNNLKNLFEDILNSTKTTINAAKDIAFSINQQVSSTEQILFTLKQISEGINSFVESTKLTTESSINLKKLTGDLSGVVEKYIV